MSTDARTIATEQALLTEVTGLIAGAKAQAAVALNAELTLLYYQVGRRIVTTVLQDVRAGYGKQVIITLSKALRARHGKGWSPQQLRHCLQFAKVFPDEAIVSALRRQLSWTHLKTLIYIENPLKRDFYLAMAQSERWSTRILASRIDSQLFERTAISKKPEETIVQELQMLGDEGQAAANRGRVLISSQNTLEGYMSRNVLKKQRVLISSQNTLRVPNSYLEHSKVFSHRPMVSGVCQVVSA